MRQGIPWLVLGALLVTALERVGEAEGRWSAELDRIGDRHGADLDLGETCRTFALQAEARISALAPWAERFGNDPKPWTRRDGRVDGFAPSAGGLSVRSVLPRDLWDAYRVGRECEVSWALLARAAQAVRERQLLDLVAAGRDGVGRAIEWLTGRIDEELQQQLVS